MDAGRTASVGVSINRVARLFKGVSANEKIPLYLRGMEVE